ncbi:MAG: preprotein translocase subunit SecG [Verrucomicrobiia bacterium]
MNALIGILTVIHVCVALFLIVLVLMQKSSEQGVGAAFGGGFTESVFGAGTTTALVRLTIWCACILLATTLSLAILHSHRGSLSGTMLQRASESTMPVMPASAPATPMTPMVPQSPAPATPVTPSAPVTPAPATATPAPAPQPEQAK